VLNGAPLFCQRVDPNSGCLVHERSIDIYFSLSGGKVSDVAVQIFDHIDMP
jgi:hypothetical protein